MTGGITRRDFVNRTAQVGVVSSLGLDRALASTETVPRRANFDEGWTFSRGDFPGAQTADYSDAAWMPVDLPHDWSIAGPYSESEPAGGSGGYLPTGVGWYRKRFTLPSAMAGKRVTLGFDGVYQRSEVWVNGHPLGMRPNGFISFGYEISPHLRFGSVENVVAVRVDNSLQPNSRWYSGSGIHRHTWLMATDPVDIADVWVRCFEVTAESAIVEVTTRVSNGGTTAASCTLQTAITTPAGTTINLTGARAGITPGAEHAFVQKQTVSRPALWSLETPQLHTVRAFLSTDTGMRDEQTTPFGIRDARFDADRGFLLNGERVKLNGVCLHNDCGAVGAAVPERMWERRLTILKEMGCNAIRTSHNPPAPEFLDLCDTMGFLVMDEAFDEWHRPKAQTPDYGYRRYFDEWSARDLAAQIERDRNHPSIVIWSLGNEVPDQTDPAGPKTLAGLAAVLRAKDPTRPFTVACDNIAAEPKPALPEFLNELDVVGYNYVDRWRDRREKFYSIDRHDFPKRRFIGTESTALGGVRGEYAFGAEAPVFGEQTDNRRIEAEQLQKFVQTYDYVSGDFMWTGFDYLGEARWPTKLAGSGVADTCGFLKDGYYFYQSQWTRKPMLHLFPHWNWHGREGETLTVSCYTNCDTVELFLNGRSLGTKGYAFPRPGMIEKWPVYPERAKAIQTTADLHLAWDVPYAPGVLTAVGTRNGAPALTTLVQTTGPAHAIRLSADRDRIAATRSDLAHVTVEIVDKNGLVVPTAADSVTFELVGSGKIIGVDNGQPDSHEPYQASTRKVFNGLALALLQATGAGAMTLSASAPSLEGARVAITGYRGGGV